MTAFTRRQIVAAAGTVTATSLAGCSGAEADEDTDSASAEGGTVLGRITAENLHDEPHSLDVIVQRNDEIAHWSSHELEEEGAGVTIERDWPDEPGDLEVIFRIDGGELTQVSPGELNDKTCVSLLMLIDRNGDSGVYVDTNAGTCPGREADATADDRED